CVIVLCRWPCSMVCASVFCYCFVFFFQAEDGIRDGHVTGVQTCALPIYARSRKGGRTSAGCSGSLGKGVRPLSLDPISPALLFPEYRSLSGSVVPALVRRDGTGAPCLSPGHEAVWTGRSTDRTSGISGGNR